MTEWRGRAQRLDSLARTLSEHLGLEHGACRGLIAEVRESLRLLRGDTGDRRLLRAEADLDGLEGRVDSLAALAREDFLPKILAEAEMLGAAMDQMRAPALIGTVAEAPPAQLQAWCQGLLDVVTRATGADRGFVSFWLPDSTEAEIVAAREFASPNLSLAEYRFSRTLLRHVLRSGESLLVEDASEHPVFGREKTVEGLRSVLVVPMRRAGRVLGAVYLENRERAAAFHSADADALIRVASFAAEHVHRAGLLPSALDHQRGVFLDVSQASREIVGEDPKILDLLALVRRVAVTDAAVLIQGETGTGKDLVARALHYQSRRCDGPFVAINCATIPKDLLESELFGVEKGAFTGATTRMGQVEEAEGGTVFLDEVGELGFQLQAKLLRFLQDHELRRVGGTKIQKANVRIIAATSRDLRAMVVAGEFSEALYFRLNVISIQVPPLRDRPDDIPLLVDHFLHRFQELYRRPVRATATLYEILKTWRLPGNVRELENLIHRLVILAEGEWVRPGDLPPELLATLSQRIRLDEDPLERLLRPPADLEELRQRRHEIRRILRDQERAILEEAVEKSGGNITAAAERLGMHRVTLQKRLGPRGPAAGDVGPE